MMLMTLERVLRDIPSLALDQFPGNCHGISLVIVQSGLVPNGRVARGVCEGVGSQHSWIVVGDPYDRKAPIIDPTLWTYRDDVDDIWHGTLQDGLHVPHGAGSIWNHGAPPEPTEAVITPSAKAWNAAGLTPLEHLAAMQFLNLCGPLDRAGWAHLAHAPVEGWPSRPIFLLMAAMGLKVLIPVDRWAHVVEGGWR